MYFPNCTQSMVEQMFGMFFKTESHVHGKCVRFWEAFQLAGLDRRVSGVVLSQYFVRHRHDPELAIVDIQSIVRELNERSTIPITVADTVAISDATFPADLEVSPGESVARVKALLRSEHRRLTFEGQILEDDHCLADYSVVKHSALELVDVPAECVPLTKAVSKPMDSRELTPLVPTAGGAHNALEWYTLTLAAVCVGVLEALCQAYELPMAACALAIGVGPMLTAHTRSVLVLCTTTTFVTFLDCDGDGKPWIWGADKDDAESCLHMMFDSAQHFASWGSYLAPPLRWLEAEWASEWPIVRVLAITVVVWLACSSLFRYMQFFFFAQYHIRDEELQRLVIDGLLRRQLQWTSNLELHKKAVASDRNALVRLWVDNHDPSSVLPPVYHKVDAALPYEQWMSITLDANQTRFWLSVTSEGIDILSWRWGKSLLPLTCHRGVSQIKDDSNERIKKLLQTLRREYFANKITTLRVSKQAVGRGAPGGRGGRGRGLGRGRGRGGGGRGRSTAQGPQLLDVAMPNALGFVWPLEDSPNRATLLGLAAEVSTYQTSLNRRWHADRGVPFRLGFVLEGPCAAGKTQFVELLAGRQGAALYVADLKSQEYTDAKLTDLYCYAKPFSFILLKGMEAFLSGNDPTKNHSTLLNVLDGPFASTNGCVTIVTCSAPCGLEYLLSQFDEPMRQLMRPGRTCQDPKCAGRRGREPHVFLAVALLVLVFCAKTCMVGRTSTQYAVDYTRY